MPMSGATIDSSADRSDDFRTPSRRSQNSAVGRTEGTVMKYYFLALGTLLLVCVGCGVLDSRNIVDNGAPGGVYTAPPAERLYRPGPMVDGPGPGVMPMLAAPAPPPSLLSQETQLRFVGPPGMQIGWEVRGGFADNQLTAPARHNFRQGATYRLKLTHIPGAGREGLTLYPTLQVYPAAPTTAAYLAHDTVPMEITDEDLDQVQSNNFVTKVIYLPNPKYQELAVAGVETLVSTRLEPGVDPVAEANRLGTILAVFRMGNMDLEMPKTAAPAGGVQDNIDQVSYYSPIMDGDKHEFAEPVPIAPAAVGLSAVPAPMVAAGSGQPGMPTSPVWGYPITSTPIGLPGPPHIPFGGPASLQSYTMRNLTDEHLPHPVDHFLVDVKHEPGYSLPAPVRHVEYKEEHPVYGEGDLAYPKWAVRGGDVGGPGGACPPPGAQPGYAGPAGPPAAGPVYGPPAGQYGPPPGAMPTPPQQ
jgi:hypothetical protein